MAYDFVMTGPVLVLLASLLSSQPLSVVDPLFPPNAVLGATVVCRLHVSSGAVSSVDVLSGDDPFAESARTALLQWRFEPDCCNSALIAVVHFRQPTLFAAGTATSRIPASGADPLLPFPKTISQPSYPPNTISGGSVVLKVDVTPNGRVSRIKELKSLGPLTAASADAVRRWIFAPARDKRGQSLPSEALVVIVYQMPVL